MSKADVLKELYVMVQTKNYNGHYGIGQRSETSEDKVQRSKDIRAFLVDLFDEDCSGEEGQLLSMLESAINDNVHGTFIDAPDEE